MDMPRLYAVSAFGIIAADYMSYEITVSPIPNAEVTVVKYFSKTGLPFGLICDAMNKFPIAFISHYLLPFHYY
jgi:hypothetical protein